MNENPRDPGPPLDADYFERVARNFLHPLIMQHPDMKDRVTLDCRRENLRLATSAQNMQNRAKFARSGRTPASKYKGVFSSPRSSLNPWRVSIRVNGEKKNIGQYTTQHEAAVAYDCAAIHYFGEFAHTNFPWKDVA